MNMIDATGHRVSGANAKGLALYEQAARELLCMVDDPVASVDAALEASPDMTMAHVLKAWLHLLGTEPAGNAVALACCDAAEVLDADPRERAHIAAARALAQGRWREAGMRLEDLSARHPRDTLALQAGHQIDFFRPAAASERPFLPGHGVASCGPGTVSARESHGARTGLLAGAERVPR
jgi:hypothetical protein